MTGLFERANVQQHSDLLTLELDFKMSNEEKDEVVSDEMTNLLTKLSQPPIANLSLLMLENLTKLNLPACGISSLPDDIGKVLPNLSILFCPKNNFEELPAVIGQCPKLQMVSFKTNNMKRIHPDALQAQMRWLILTDNALTEIPPEIGRCVILQKFMLSGNQIQKIPEEIGNCKNLELIRLASNDLKEPPPMALLQLPSLAWIALSDNPFLKDVVNNVGDTSSLKILDYPALESCDAEVLGQGASGVTRKVTWKGEDVAVKTYSGSMTSDGNPQTEKKLSLTASSIPSEFLISLKGQTPNGSLVMELLQNYAALAGPPSMESCSRDVYPDGLTLEEPAAVNMVEGLLATLAALHKKGISHSDFYSHNILISADDAMKVKLSDFGAAFFYEPEETYGKLIQQIEMRAFGIFVLEVRSLLKDEESDVSDRLYSLAEDATTCWSFEDLLDQWNEKAEEVVKMNED